MKPGKTGVKRIVNAARYSWAGVSSAWKNEAAFRQEAMLVALGLPLALWFGKSGIERALLVGSLLLVIIVELLNSAIEAVVDRIGSELHPLSGLAKDLGSAAVLFSLVLAAVVWILVLLG